jgi:hypothetical protein
MSNIEAIRITDETFVHYEILARQRGYAHLFQKWANPDGFNHHDYIVYHYHVDAPPTIEFLYEHVFVENYEFIDLRPQTRAYSAVVRK